MAPDSKVSGHFVFAKTLSRLDRFHCPRYIQKCDDASATNYHTRNPSLSLRFWRILRECGEVLTLTSLQNYRARKWGMMKSLLMFTDSRRGSISCLAKRQTTQKKTPRTFMILFLSTQSSGLNSIRQRFEIHIPVLERGHESFEY